MNIAINLENAIKKEIKEIVTELGYGTSEFEVQLEKPKDKSNGDYSTNTAMKLTKIAKKAPRMIAEDVIAKINKDKLFIEKITIAGPGFINFYMDKSYLTTVIKEIIDKKDNYGNSNYGNNKKVNVEFVSVNPTGDIHLGHARGAAIGDTLCRLLSTAGYDVTREYYVNDAGMQIHNLTISAEARYLQELGFKAEMPEDGYHGPDIIEMAKKLKEDFGDKFVKDSNRYAFFRKFALEYELNKIKDDLNIFGVHFDVWSSEQAIRNAGKVEKVIDTLENNNHLYKQEDAVWFRSTDFGDDKDRVLIKSDGNYTYLTPDIAYHADKYERGFDQYIDILGADHHGYINRLKASIDAQGYDSNKLNVIIIQMVRLLKNGEEYKMSKRAGTAITLRDLVEEVGVDPTRYFFAMRSADTQMDFDIDLATKKSSENPVYYAQYAHARMCSILRQAGELGLDFSILNTYNLIKEEKEFDLLKVIADLPKVIIESAENKIPHKVTNYINELATAFHKFYSECKVVDVDNKELSQERLALVVATKITLHNALNIIGVSSPEKM